MPEPQRAACAGHLPAIRSFFRVSGGHGALGRCWGVCRGPRPTMFPISALPVPPIPPPRPLPVPGRIPGAADSAAAFPVLPVLAAVPELWLGSLPPPSRPGEGGSCPPHPPEQLPLICLGPGSGSRPTSGSSPTSDTWELCRDSPGSVDPCGGGGPWERGGTVPSGPLLVAGGHGRDQRQPLRGGDAGGAAPSAGTAGAPRPSPTQEDPPGHPGAGGEWGSRCGNGESDGCLLALPGGVGGFWGSHPVPCAPQGTNYRKTNPALELQRTQRDSFWEQAEVRGRGAGEGLGGSPRCPGIPGWGHGCCLGLGLPGAEPRGPSAGVGCRGVPVQEARSVGVPLLMLPGSHCRYHSSKTETEGFWCRYWCGARSGPGPGPDAEAGSVPE